MRKVREYTAKNKNIFVGLEDSKRTWKLSVRSEGMEIYFGSMPAKYPMLRDFFRNRFPGCRVKVIYEAGFRGFWLHDLLVDDGFACIVTPPSRVTHEVKRNRKNDTNDARRLATVLEKDDCKSCNVPDKERREDRQISRTLYGYRKDIISWRNRIRRFADLHGVAEDMPAGAWNESHYAAFRERPLSTMLAVARDRMYATLDHLLETVKALTDLLKGFCKKERYARAVALLQSVPGVGWMTALRLVLEWGEDWRRFASSKKVAAYSGLICSEYSTGESVHTGRITGDSAPHVRAWLVQCAWTAIRKDPVLLDKYQRVWRNSGSKKKAIVAVARMLVVRMRALLVTDQTYSCGVVA